MMKFDGSDGVFPVVEISGGLGNQLFQYAFARKLQQVTGVSPVLSLLSYKKSIHQQRRKVEINSFLNFEFDYFPDRIPTWRLDKLGDHLRTSKRFKNNLKYLDLVPETDFCFSAGQMARPINTSQITRPTSRKICQKRPRSTYS